MNPLLLDQDGREAAFEEATRDVFSDTIPPMNETHKTSLNELSKLAYQNAVDKGFHDDDYEKSTVELYAKWTANIHGEVSELWEAARKGELKKSCDKASFMEDQLGESLTCEEEELADIIIRVLDTAGARSIDIGRAVLLKMAYNATRPHMHGKLA